MCSTVASPPRSLAAAVAELERAAAATVTVLDGGGLAEVRHDELADAILALRRVVDRCESGFLRCVREVDRSGSYVADGALCATAWLRWRARLTGPAAATAVRTARELDRRLPGLARELAAGTIAVEAARVVARGVRDASDSEVAALEPIAVGVALASAPDQVAAALRRFRSCLDPDEGAAAALRRQDRQGLSWATTYDGMVALHGLLDEETGAAVMTAIGAAARPVPRDPRRPAQRRAAALGRLCRAALDEGRVPRAALVHPHVVLTVDTETLQRRPGHAAADLTHVGPVCPDTARRLACDADLTVVGLDGRGRVVDLGRSRRFFTAAQKRAIAARDGDACCWPGCDRPADWTDAHHDRHWADGGATDVANGRLPCRPHHTALHEGGWSLRPTGDGHYLARHRSGREVWPDGPRAARPPPTAPPPPLPPPPPPPPP